MPLLNLDYSYVPADYCVEGLRDYFEKHVKPGDFLTGLLENDFAKVMRHADPVNAGRLKDWAQWMHNEPGMYSHGSPEKVSDWVALRGVAAKLPAHSKTQEAGEA